MVALPVSELVSFLGLNQASHAALDCFTPPAVLPLPLQVIKPQVVEKLAMLLMVVSHCYHNQPAAVCFFFPQVIKPQVVEKLAMLLMVVSQEEHDRRLGLAPPTDGEQQQQQREQQQQHQAQQPGDQQPGEQQQQQTQQPGTNGLQAAAGVAAAVKQEPGEATAMDVDAPAAAAASDQPQQGPAANGPGGGGSSSPAAGAAGTAGAAGDAAEWEAQERLVLSEFRDTLQVCE